ncbi:CpaF family protein [Streptomonospora nanhaiensis]|uniref:CpaF family protein n=1 Tax=Streptomonospora nanhaiensis TaxID=1323731 RepID=UPI001C99CD5E|nr:ATPase, T2SS/T4P/T4SS family [Streptomonospora nanhaiensis]MBX9388830.1 Flp pilus assembly complex ATPase component TadA [Streptomonospora nanhaiensis]
MTLIPHPSVGTLPAPSPTPVEAVAQMVAERVTSRLLAEGRLEAGAAGGEEARRRVASVVDEVLDAMAADALAQGRAPLDAAQEQQVRTLAVARICGMGGLEPLLAEPGVHNILITGEKVIVDFGGGRREPRPPVADDDAELAALVRRIAASSPSGERRFDASSPLLSMELPDGSRLSAVMEVSRRVSVAIRRHPRHALDLNALQSSDMLDGLARGLLEAAASARMNLLISGATGAGKTTLLRAPAVAAVAPWERVVTVEDSLELNLDRSLEARCDCVALQARPANVEGVGEVTLAELVRHALRLSPDRVIVGETRGPETIALLNAMSMGTDGSMATIHAGSSAQVFTKIAAYTAQAPERLSLEAANLLAASAVHLVAHIAVDPRGRRWVSSIREVLGAEGVHVVSNEVYHRPRPQGAGRLLVAPSSERADVLAAHGFDAAAAFSAGGAW